MLNTDSKFLSKIKCLQLFIFQHFGPDYFIVISFIHFIRLPYLNILIFDSSYNSQCFSSLIGTTGLTGFVELS